VVRGPSRTFNPTLPEKIVLEALKRDPAAARAEWLAEFRDDISAFLSRDLIESAVDRGVMARPPVEDELYLAFADPSGGLGDSFSCAIAHRDINGRVILDALHETTAPFDPGEATAAVAKLVKSYGVGRIVSDKYAALWPVSEFARHDVTLEHSERDRSAFYADFLPLLTSGRARLLDSPRLVGQLANLERRAQPSGKDRIDHPAGAHDDLSNAAAGAMTLAAVDSLYNDYSAWVSDGIEEVVPGPPISPDVNVLRHPFFTGVPPWLLQ
jgi:hypothetical protein